MNKSFTDILTTFRATALSEAGKGACFERLMQAYLRTDPKYKDRFKVVWLWNEFPFRKDFGDGHDIGIDLVAITTDDDYWAIQCKCFQQDSYIDKHAVDTFLATSSKTFGTDKRFKQRLWISTTNNWTTHAEEAIEHQNPPVTRILLYDLQTASVDWDKLVQGVHGTAARAAKKSLRPHQMKAVEDAFAHFKNHDRGKLIMACGTGKTFTALRIAEKETNGKGLVLFLVPSIALLGQTLNEWFADADEPLNAICICSDPDITKSRKKQDDTDAMSVVDLALPPPQCAAPSPSAKPSKTAK